MQKNGNENLKKKMPIWIKRLLLVFGIVILLGGSYVIYLLKFKEYDVADSEVTEITRETFNIELPDGSTIALDEAKTYTVATNSFTAKGGDGFTMFGKAYAEGRVSEPGFVDYENFIEYITSLDEVNPTVEGRIIDISKVATPTN